MVTLFVLLTLSIMVGACTDGYLNVRDDMLAMDDAIEDYEGRLILVYLGHDKEEWIA